MVRVSLGEASSRSTVAGVEQAALAGGRVGQGVAHPPKIGPLELSDGRHREVALRPVDHGVRHDAAAGPLEHALAAVGQLQLRRDRARELDELVVQERHPGLQPPGHRHVVDPLHRVVDEHDRRVVAQRGVHRGPGPGSPEALGDVRRRCVVIDQPVRLQQPGHRRPAAVEEHPGVRLDGLLARHPDQRRIPVVPAEHLVRALAGLDDLDRLRDLLAEQVERDAVVADHRLAHRRDRRVDPGQQLRGVDLDPVVVGVEVLAPPASSTRTRRPTHRPRSRSRC